MRIAVTKQPEFFKHISYATLAAGTTSDVWYDDEKNDKKARQSCSKADPSTH